MAERDPSFSYLKLSASQRTYLIQMITGKTDTDIRLTMPNAKNKKGTGVSQALIRKWRQITPEFRYAEKRARDEPMWVAINIGLPLLFAAQLEEDVQVMTGGAPRTKIPYLNARRLELLSLQLGLSSPDTATQNRTLSVLVTNMNLVLPELQPSLYPQDIQTVEALPNQAFIEMDDEEDQ
jgi:hypothetical protein